MSSQPETSEPGQIITFYSYKGGTGRSMALANVACLLAQRQEGYGGVLVVDWDLEAPGLHNYFANKFQRRFPDPDRASARADLNGHPGLIEFFSMLREHVERLPVISDEPSPQVQQELAEAAPLDSFILPTDIPNLWLMKAGAFDEDYAKRVNTFPWEALYARAPWLIPWVAECLATRFRYTLVDSRTGITDTSGICTMLLPDKLVAVFTPNQQSLDGVLQLTERAANYRRTSSDLRPLSVFPLPSRIEKDVVQLAEWRKGEGTGYQPRFETLFEKIWELKDCNLEAYLNEVQIQHSPDYAFGEKVAVLIETGDNRLGLKRSYASFTERLVTLHEPWESLVQFGMGPTPPPEVQQAESIYAQLTPEQQDSARRLFLQLIRVPQDSSRAVGREVKFNNLPADARAIFPRFAEQKMLGSRLNTDGDTFVSLSGETLLANWRKLAEWIETDIDFLHWRDSLDAALANWEKFKRDKEGLLRGHPLEEAAHRKNLRAKDLNQAEIVYIDASLAAGIRRNRLNFLYAAVAVGNWRDRLHLPSQ